MLCIVLFVVAVSAGGRKKALGGAAISYNVTVDGSIPLQITSEGFLGVNIDAASLYQGTRLDFNDKNLRILGARLTMLASPARVVLRVGGSAADSLGWGNSTNQTISMSTKYFDELMSFAQQSDFDVSFDLNAMQMRTPEGAWNYSDASAILNHATSIGERPFAVQLGNEPGHWQTRHGGTPTAAQHGADFIVLRELLDSIHGMHAVRIQGPDICNGHLSNDSPCANPEYLEQLLTAAQGSIDDVTVHAYGLTGPGKPDNQCQIESFLNPALWEERMTPVVQTFLETVRKFSSTSKLVLSETASSARGGCPGLSNAFIAGFYFLDALGMFGKMGLWQVYRQDLVGYSGVNFGSSYALAGDPGWFSEAASGPLHPNPDFFTALVWMKVMGARVLDTKMSSAGAAGPVRVYSTCAIGGGVAVAYINPAPSALSLLLKNVDGGFGREIYVFTAPGGSLTSRQTLLNGMLLNATSPLTAASVPSGPVAFPPLSFGFIVDRNVALAACRSTVTDHARSDASGPRRTRPHQGGNSPPTDGAIDLAEVNVGRDCLDPRDYGAVVGDPGAGPGPNWRANTAAIQKAIDDCTSESSACVALMGGDYVASDIYLRSNMQFRIEEGSRLLLAVNVTKTSLIHVVNQTNVTLAGSGTVYGNAEHYISYYSAIDDRFQPTFADGGRPHLLWVDKSTDVRVLDLFFRNNSDWNLRISESVDVLINRVDIRGDQRFPNNDGIEPDSCTRLHILNSKIDVADDGISPISSVDRGPLSGLYVRNTTIRSKSHAIKFGSACDADCYDCLFENVTIWDSNSGLAIQQRGTGSLYNITFQDISVETRYQAPRWWGNGEWLSITVERRYSGDPEVGEVYDLVFRNITAVSENGGLLSGRDGSGIHNVLFDNVTVAVAEGVGNYSDGQGPECYFYEKGNMTCMGTADHRPTYLEDINCPTTGNCRTPAKANGLYLENAHNVSIHNVNVEFRGTKRLPWFGDCVAQDDKASGVVITGTRGCVNGPPN